MRPVRGISRWATRWATVAGLLFALVAMGAGPVSAGEAPSALEASYAFKARFSTAKSGETLGTGAVEGAFSLAFGEPDQDGQKRVVITLDRVEAPGIPGMGEMAQQFAGAQATLVFDRNGRLVDIDLPIPPEMLEAVREGIRSALPPAPPETAEGAEEAPDPRQKVSLPTVLKAVRPGTVASFRLTVPGADGTPDQNEVTADVKFEGPDESGSVYGILFRFDMDITGEAGAAGTADPLETATEPAATLAEAPGLAGPLAAASGTVKGELQARAGFRLDNGLLQSLDLETAWTAPAKDGAPSSLGLKLTVELLATESSEGK